VFSRTHLLSNKCHPDTSAKPWCREYEISDFTKVNGHTKQRRRQRDSDMTKTASHPKILGGERPIDNELGEIRIIIIIHSKPDTI